MFRCNTLVIQNQNNPANGLNLGGVELSINDDGSLKTKDSNGKESIFKSSKVKHLEIEVRETIQSVSNTNETEIFFDESTEILVDSDFLIDGNSIRILSEGHFFISFNITLDMYSGSKTTVNGYIKTKKENGDFELLPKSSTYEYFVSSNRGYSSIPNSLIYDMNKNEEIKFYVKIKEGSGKFYTVPESINFNLFKIE